MSEEELQAWAAKQCAEHPEAGKSLEEWKEHGRRMEEACHGRPEGRERPPLGGDRRRAADDLQGHTAAEWDAWVEDFVSKNGLDGRCAEMLRGAEREHQEAVISRGSLADVRNPTAVCMARLRDAKSGLLKPKGKGKGDGGGAGDGVKGKGKGKDELPPAPEKLGGDAWERPRAETGLQLLGETCPPEVQWQYPLRDDSRRCYAGFLPSPLDEADRQRFFDTVKGDTQWQQPEGRRGLIPRKTAWMVCAGCKCHYSYGGFQVPPQEYPPWMIDLLRRVMPRCGLPEEGSWPTSCNLNLYDDGGMSVGWHADDEALFQGKFRDISIISLSLGVSRKFELRLNWPEDGEMQVRRMLLSSGDLMTMEGMVQKHYQHRVPREENVQGPRINLTWRWTLKHQAGCPAGRSRPALATPRHPLPAA